MHGVFCTTIRSNYSYVVNIQKHVCHCNTVGRTMHSDLVKSAKKHQRNTAKKLPQQLSLPTVVFIMCEFPCNWIAGWGIMVYLFGGEHIHTTTTAVKCHCQPRLCNSLIPMQVIHVPNSVGKAWERG